MKSIQKKIELTCPYCTHVAKVNKTDFEYKLKNHTARVPITCGECKNLYRADKDFNSFKVVDHPVKK